MTKTGTADRMKEMRFKNLFLEHVACDIHHADKYWINWSDTSISKKISNDQELIQSDPTSLSLCIFLLLRKKI